MPPDGHGLLPGQADKAVDHIDRFLPVAVGEGVLIGEGGHLGPLAVLSLHIPGGGFVTADLAHVVEQGHQGNGFRAVLQAIEVRDPLPGQVIGETVVNIQAVLAQAAGIGPMVPG